MKKLDSTHSNLALMFTDLEGSTELYGRLGDEAALRIVLQHFELIADVLRRHDGTLVKTMGDAIMATFAEPLNALKAALEIQIRNSSQPARSGGELLRIRIGLHCGPCFSTGSSEHLDHFGNTVNLAARVQSLCQGGDIVLTDAMVRESKVALLLAAHSGRARRFKAVLKGINDRLDLIRIEAPKYSPRATESSGRGVAADASCENRQKQVRYRIGGTLGHILTVIKSRGRQAALLCLALIALTACRAFDRKSSSSVSGFYASSEGNGIGYTGGTYRGPQKASVVLGKVMTGSDTSAFTMGITLDSAGNTILSGQAYQTIPEGMGYFAFLEKFTPTGKKVWGIPLLAPYALARGLAADDSGNIFVTGSISPLGLDLLIPGAAQYGVPGLNEMFVAKVDADGNLLWLSVLGGGDPVHIAGGKVALDASGNVLVLSGASGAVPGATQYGKNGTGDLVVSKFSPAGVLQWSTQLGDSGSNTAGNSLVVGASGDFWTLGSTSGQPNGGNFVSSIFGSHGTSDILLCGFAADGQLKWASQLGSALAQSGGSGVVVDPSGDLLVGGATEGLLGGTQLGQHGVRDLVFARFDSSGQLKWVRQIGSTSKSFGSSGLVRDSKGNFYLGGSGDGIFAQAGYYGKGGQENSLVASFDGQGKVRWITEMGDPGRSNYGIDLSISLAGDVYQAVMTNSLQNGDPSNWDIAYFRLSPAGDVE